MPFTINLSSRGSDRGFEVWASAIEGTGSLAFDPISFYSNIFGARPGQTTFSVDAQDLAEGVWKILVEHGVPDGHPLLLLAKSLINAPRPQARKVRGRRLYRVAARPLWPRQGKPATRRIKHA